MTTAARPGCNAETILHARLALHCSRPGTTTLAAPAAADYVMQVRPEWPNPFYVAEGHSSIGPRGSTCTYLTLSRSGPSREAYLPRVSMEHTGTPYSVHHIQGEHHAHRLVLGLGWSSRGWLQLCTHEPSTPHAAANQHHRRPG